MNKSKFFALKSNTPKHQVLLLRTADGQVGKASDITTPPGRPTSIYMQFPGEAQEHLIPLSHITGFTYALAGQWDAVLVGGRQIAAATNG